MNKMLRLLSVGVFAMAFGACAMAQVSVPGENSKLYYKIGGGEPVSRSANPNHIHLKLGLGGMARVNYSCGRFDAAVSIQNLMNGFAALGDQVSLAAKAGIASLPLYILQRASPGLYELFQTFKELAMREFNLALKSCEEMEAQIKAGGDPYAEWLGKAKAENWTETSLSSNDAVTSKKQVEQDGGSKGVTWLCGQKRGGVAQDAINVVRDLTQAGVNITMNQSPCNNPNATIDASTKLGKTFPTATAAADWLTAVIGDQHIATCNETACPTKASSPGTGLLQKFDTERPLAETQLAAAAGGTGVPDRTVLEAASAPGVAMTRELVDAIRNLRAPERQIVLGRLSIELAQARVIDKALTARNLLLTGSGAPEAGYDPAQKEVRDRVERLNRYIDDLLFETRVRREVVSSTALALIDEYTHKRMESSGVATQAPRDTRPMENGRVK